MRRGSWRIGRRQGTRLSAVGAALVLALTLAGAATLRSTGSAERERTYRAGAAILTVVEQPHAKGVLVTTGGWAYCQQVRALARRSELTLLCGRFPEDGYVGPGLRARRHLDWGNAAYLRSLARETIALHRRVGGELLLVGVSYSGFGVAALASHHPELRPDRLIVIDSYLDLAARRAAAGTGATGREIDAETGGSSAALEARSVRVDGLAALVASGTRLQVIWSIAPDEAREFKGATCSLAANAGTLQRLANALAEPVAGWVTKNRHGHDLWDQGRRILRGVLPGKRVTFRPGGSVPPNVVCS
jgi:pimeloyl-ACP methyl ester carboxylesterase